jgi:hypothetical protein
MITLIFALTIVSSPCFLLYVCLFPFSHSCHFVIGPWTVELAGKYIRIELLLLIFAIIQTALFCILFVS